MKILLISPDGFKYEPGKNPRTLHVSDGSINLTKLKPWTYIKTNTGVRYAVIDKSFIDKLNSSERGPQVILPTDAAAIIAYTGLGSGDKVLDAGAGSGWLAAMLGNIVGPSGKVISYEIKKEHAEIAKKNIESFRLKNVQIKLGDITKGIKEKDIDLITLDLLSPTKVKGISKALKKGKYCVAYVPHLKQAEEFAVFAEKQNLLVERIIETKESTWILKNKKLVKRKNKIRHTGYLVFTRKVVP